MEGVVVGVRLSGGVGPLRASVPLTPSRRTSRGLAHDLLVGPFLLMWWMTYYLMWWPMRLMFWDAPQVVRQRRRQRQNPLPRSW